MSPPPHRQRMMRGQSRETHGVLQVLRLRADEHAAENRTLGKDELEEVLHDRARLARIHLEQKVGVHLEQKVGANAVRLLALPARLRRQLDAARADTRAWSEALGTAEAAAWGLVDSELKAQCAAVASKYRTLKKDMQSERDMRTVRITVLEVQNKKSRHLNLLV